VQEITLADLFHLPYGSMVTDTLKYTYLTDSKRPNVARYVQMYRIYSYCL
jgi:hypothetical protein